MSAWRFYPLRDYPDAGVLVGVDGPKPARFLTLKQAKDEQPRQIAAPEARK